jgi:predicted Zn-dependent protease
VNLTPSSPDLQLSLALALAANGRLRDAIPHATEALRLRPDFSAARDCLSAMQSDLNRMKEQKP